MEGYLYSIEQAVYFFPVVAAIISVPYFYYQYKRNGVIEFKKSLLSFSFILYILCCYGLVILPLPSFEEVNAMTGPYIDLRVFGFVQDFFKYSAISLNPGTWFKALRGSLFYIPALNLIMLIPFGIYQKRLFSNSLAKSTFLAFLLSLSFELIQLSALFGLYPHPYRLFQVDDLILNTLGSVIGYKFADKIKVPKKTTEKASEAAPAFKERACAFILDMFALSLIIRVVSAFLNQPSSTGIFMNDYLSYLLAVLLYFCLLTWFLGARTPGSFLLNLKYNSPGKKRPSFISFLFRQLVVFALIVPIPVVSLLLLDSNLMPVIKIPLGVLLILIPVIVFVQIYTDSVPVYESVTKVYLTDVSKVKSKKTNRGQQV